MSKKTDPLAFSLACAKRLQSGYMREKPKKDEKGKKQKKEKLNYTTRSQGDHIM